jgi:RNA recognition motif-containing protein
MAFCFVECDSEESIRKAIKALQGTIVDGHALELKRSSKAAASSVPKKSQGSNPTKLMVRNVPFQATRKELLQLFHRACIAFRMMRWPLFLLATYALFFQIVWLFFFNIHSQTISCIHP